MAAVASDMVEGAVGRSLGASLEAVETHAESWRVRLRSVPGADGGSDGGMSSGGSPVPRDAFLAACASLRAASAARRSAILSFCESVLPPPDEVKERWLAGPSRSELEAHALDCRVSALGVWAGKALAAADRPSASSSSEPSEGDAMIGECADASLDALAALRACSSLRRCSMRARCEAVDSPEAAAEEADERFVSGASLVWSLSIADACRVSERSDGRSPPPPESRPLPELGDCGGCIGGGGRPAALAASRAALAALRAASSWRRISILLFCSSIDEAVEELPGEERLEPGEEASCTGERAEAAGVVEPLAVRRLRSASTRRRSSMRPFCSAISSAEEPDERCELGASLPALEMHAELVRVSVPGDSSLEAVVSSVGSGGASAVPDGLGEDEMGDATAGLGDLPPAFLATLASASFCWRSASICRRCSSRSRWLEVVLSIERFVAPPESLVASDEHAEVVRPPSAPPPAERAVPPESLHSERAEASPAPPVGLSLAAAMASLRACSALRRSCSAWRCDSVLSAAEAPLPERFVSGASLAALEVHADDWRVRPGRSGEGAS